MPALIAGVTLAVLLERCAPSASSDTMAAIIVVESAGDELALQDNTLHRSFHPRDHTTAIRLAETLIGRGHNVDLGLSQVNSVHLGAGVTVESLLEPCANVQVGSSILAADYRVAAARFHDPRAALAGAIAAYNTGSIYAGEGYVRRVVAAAMRAPVVPSIAILTGRVTPPPPMPAAVRPHPAKPHPTPSPELGLGYSVPLTLSRSNLF